MRYFSTRDADRNRAFSLKEAAFMGLAPDGGLFMPESIPEADLEEIARLAEISYADMAFYLAKLFFGDSIAPDILEEMMHRIYDFDCPLKQLGGNIQVLELFHGPTFAFKDFGARFMGAMLGILGDVHGGCDEQLIVLTATSGDTGSAVAAGFHGVPGIDVVVLFPEGKISPLQESQMTTLGGNIHPVCVRGSFDDCQALVKAVFNDSDFRLRHRVTSANSINILRWIPQSFYYFYAWAQWRKNAGTDAPDIVVPSGNYGNITAAMLAAGMGLPVRRFVAAANANDVIPEYLKSGVYTPRPSVRTVANAMDVGAPSNHERMMYLYNFDFQKLVNAVEGYSYSDAEILQGIRAIYAKHNYISDPHGAVGYLAYRDSGAEGFYLATAHSAKFGEIIHEALGRSFPLPESLAQTLAKERNYQYMDNDLASLEALTAAIR